MSFVLLLPVVQSYSFILDKMKLFFLQIMIGGILLSWAEERTLHPFHWKNEVFCTSAPPSHPLCFLMFFYLFSLLSAKLQYFLFLFYFLLLSEWERGSNCFSKSKFEKKKLPSSVSRAHIELLGLFGWAGIPAHQGNWRGKYPLC